MIRFGNSSDIEKIVSIYEDAKKLFSDLGYFQWKGNYPNIDNAINDINNNKVLVTEIDNDIVCTIGGAVVRDSRRTAAIGNRITAQRRAGGLTVGVCHIELHIILIDRVSLSSAACRLNGELVAGRDNRPRYRPKVPGGWTALFFRSRDRL